MKRKYFSSYDLVLCRSDKGGWSLHSPWATDEQITNGDEPPLESGEAALDQNGNWNRPNHWDRQRAMNVLNAQDKARFGR